MEEYDQAIERLETIRQEVQAIKQAFAAEEHSPFKNIRLCGLHVNFEFCGEKEKRSYSIKVCDQYPTNSILSCTVDDSDEEVVTVYDVRLPEIFSALKKELSSPNFQPSESSSTVASSQLAGADDYDQGSSYYNEDELDPLNADLQEDFKSLQAFCPEAEILECPALDEVQVKLPIAIDFLETQMAKAWRLIPNEPVLISLIFSFRNYWEDGGFSRVDVIQTEGKKNGVGVPLQLQGIVTEFVKRSVEELSQQRDKRGCDGNQLLPNLTLDPPEAKIPRISASSTEQSDPKNPPCLGLGLLVDVLSYAQQRLRTLNSFCVICDDGHAPAKSAMLKPSVCDKELCVFAVEKLGMRKDCNEEACSEIIGEGADVVDLLITLAKAAAFSARYEMILEPYPFVVNPEKTEEFSFTPKDKSTIDHLRNILSRFIPVEEMASVSNIELKATMNASNKLLYPLLHWVISSNRSHLVSLKADQRLTFMKTPYQFLLRSAPPAKEEAFKKAKALHGSLFAFHGSVIENWHSILRNGLMVASGTDFQLNGAVYGKGIYLSPSASLSFSYSTNSKLSLPAGQSDPPSEKSLHLLPSQSIVCLALCEVVASDSLQKVTNEIWIMPEPDLVVTRFFFVFKDADQQKAAGRSDDPETLNEIMRAAQC